MLPFENATRDTSSDLIHNASVSLLYQEMSRWHDVRVIPDNRVADLLRRAPAAEGRLGMSAAADLARRAGAGRLVTGSYVGLRGRASVTATVTDVRTGRELRVVREPLSGLSSDAALDSLSASFGRIARGVLAVPAGTRAASVGLGTTSIEAYRAYVGGMAALNRLDIDSCQALFSRAVALDSNFALARLRLWQVSPDTLIRRGQLEAAFRLAEHLPPHDRALVESFMAMSSGNIERLCSVARQFVADDSLAADAWTMLARCYLDPRVIVEGRTARLRGDPTLALRAALRAYALEPNAVEVISTLLNALVPSSRTVCGREGGASGTCPPDSLFRVSQLLRGDSFAVTIRPWTEARRAPADLLPEAIADVQRRTERTVPLVEQLLAATPNSGALLHLRASLALQTGDTARAAAIQSRLGPRVAVDTLITSRSQMLLSALALALARERFAEAAAYADSLFARPQTSSRLYSLFGRFGEGATSEAGRSYAVWRQVFSGVIPPGFDTLEARLDRTLTGPQHDDYLRITTLAVFHMRAAGPALDTAALHPIKRYQAWAARHDLARARAALDEFDHELAARHPATPDDGGWLFSTEAHAELGDTIGALERMRDFARRWVFIASQLDNRILEQWYFQAFSARLWGRTWLLYGDLAMAAGQRADARRAYRAVVGLWQGGEPAVQPIVARARAALAQLGN